MQVIAALADFVSACSLNPGRLRHPDHAAVGHFLYMHLLCGLTESCGGATYRHEEPTLMDPIIAAGMATTLAVNALGVVSRWSDARQSRLRLNELTRCDLARNLPGGSRIVDIGLSAVVIQVGDATSDHEA